jgi:hypothetical protein
MSLSKRGLSFVLIACVFTAATGCNSPSSAPPATAGSQSATAPSTATAHFDSLAKASFVKDYPTADTARTLREELLFQRAVQTYLWSRLCRSARW